MQKLIELVYIINLIIMLSTKLVKKFNLELKISQLRNCHKNWIGKDTTLITSLKK